MSYCKKRAAKAAKSKVMGAVKVAAELLWVTYSKTPGAIRLPHSRLLMAALTTPTALGNEVLSAIWLAYAQSLNCKKTMVSYNKSGHTKLMIKIVILGD